MLFSLVVFHDRASFLGRGSAFFWVVRLLDLKSPSAMTLAS